MTEMDIRFPPNDPDDIGKFDRFKWFVRKVELTALTRARSVIEECGQDCEIISQTCSEQTKDAIDALILEVKGE